MQRDPLGLPTPSTEMAPKGEGRRKHAYKRTASPFGAPFSFGTPLRLNSQPHSTRSKLTSSPGAVKHTLHVLKDDVLDSRGGRNRASRKAVGGYGVTPAAEYPDLLPFSQDTTTATKTTRAPGVAATPAAQKTRAPGDAVDVVAAARVASAEHAASAASDTAYARGKAARLAAAAAAPRVAFGGRPPPKQVLPPRLRQLARRGAAGKTLGRGNSTAKKGGAKGNEDDYSSDSASSSYGSGSEKENITRRYGPAYSFGARTCPVPGVSLWWAGAPPQSPGPGAYGDPKALLQKHIPVVTFGKPKSPGGTPGKDSGMKRRPGVWDPLGATDPDVPGPGHYYAPERDAAKIGRAGPRFSFGGGKDDIGKLRTAGPWDTPGPGAYYKEEPSVAPVGGSPNSKSCTFGARVGSDWASSGPGQDAPPPGSYFKNLDTAGQSVRTSANGGIPSAPSFTFGGGALRDANEQTAQSSPGPGEYAQDSSYGTDTVGDEKQKRSPTKTSGYTFGFRRDDANDASGKSQVPGPGAYDVGGVKKSLDGFEDPDATKPGPAFSLAKKLPGPMDKLDKTSKETPGPGEYDTQRPGEGVLGDGPAFTMGGGPVDDGNKSPDPKLQSPGPGAYATGREPGRDAPAFTMYGRVPDVAKDKASASLPGPGAYDVVRPVPGSPSAETGGASSVRSPGATLKGREAWEREGLDSAGKHSPGPAAYVSDAVSRPHGAAPAYTMAGRPERSDATEDPSPGPGDYAPEPDDANGSRKKKGVTFGKRPAQGGALSHLGEAALKPGPGAYHNPGASDARDRGPSYTIQNRTDGKNGVGKVVEPSDEPGPGEYYDEHADDFAFGGDTKKGVTIAGRTPKAGAENISFGNDSPGPAYYVGAWTTDDLDRGPEISFLPEMQSGRDAPGGPLDGVRRRASIPGPGYYAPEVFQFPIRDAPEGNNGPGGEFLWAPKGYTFGWHGSYGEEVIRGSEEVGPGPGEYYPDANDSNGVYGFGGNNEALWRPKPGITIGTLPQEKEVRQSKSSPGPGAYYNPEDTSTGSAGKKGPKRGVKIADRKVWERQKSREKKSDVPAPTDYDVRTSGTKRLTERRVPSHTIQKRYEPSERERRDILNAPAPGQYETNQSKLRVDGGVKFGDPPRRDASTHLSRQGPAPGEYEPDFSEEALKSRNKKTAVNIGRGTTRDAPGGVFDGATRNVTPGPGEFELDGEAKARVEAQERRRGAVDIRRSTTRNAPGGVFDGIGDDTPGPGAFWPDGERKNTRGLQFSSTSHASKGGALDAALRGGETPGPGEFWPDDSDTQKEGARVPGFTMPRSQRDIGKTGGDDEVSPGPGEFYPEIDSRTGAAGGKTLGSRRGTVVDMNRGTGRETRGGGFDTREGPGPGEHYPDLVFDDGRGGKSSKSRGVKWSDLPEKNESDKKVFVPGPGEYEPKLLQTVGPATMPKAPKRSSLVTRDAENRPGPGEHEPDDDRPNPMTVVGLLRRKMATGVRVEPTPEQRRAANDRRALRAESAANRPGPSSYDIPNSSIRNDKGVKVQTRKRWERLGDMEAAGGSGMGPGKYNPKPEAVAPRLKPGKRVPRGNDFEDSYRSTLVRKGVEKW